MDREIHPDVLLTIEFSKRLIEVLPKFCLHWEVNIEGNSITFKCAMKNTSFRYYVDITSGEIDIYRDHIGFSNSKQTELVLDFINEFYLAVQLLKIKRTIGANNWDKKLGVITDVTHEMEETVTKIIKDVVELNK